LIALIANPARWNTIAGTHALALTWRAMTDVQAVRRFHQRNQFGARDQRRFHRAGIA
jgi:hypothetical protein